MLLIVLGIFLIKDNNSFPKQQEKSTTIKNAETLKKVLNKKQIDVSIKGNATQAPVLGSGKVISINNEEVQVYEYESYDKALLVSHQIAPDGYTINNIVYDWEIPPHFFQKDNVLVFYLGSNSTVITALFEALGPQIAGSRSTIPGF